jgi:hypothetical protein
MPRAVAALLCLSATAAADVSVPTPRSTGSWVQRCKARLDRAVVELTRLDPKFAKTVVLDLDTRDDQRLHVFLCGKQCYRADVARTGAQAPTEWTEDTSNAGRWTVHRGFGAAAASLEVEAPLTALPSPFVPVFQRAVEECAALADAR